MSGSLGDGSVSPADVLSSLAAPASAAAAQARVAQVAALEARNLAAAAAAASPALAAADRPARIQGLRNRLLLKYLGVDFEMFTQGDQVYRAGA